MNGIDPGLHEPLAHLDRIGDRVARRPPPEQRQRIVVLGRADLHLQVKVVPDLGADRLDDVEDEARAVLEACRRIRPSYR